MSKVCASSPGRAQPALAGLKVRPRCEIVTLDTVARLIPLAKRGKKIDILIATCEADRFEAEGVTAINDNGPDYGGYPSLTEGVHAAIRREILTSTLVPGSKLRLEELKQRHRTGIAPIREALARLAGEGLVDTKSQRGFWVAEISSDELQQLGDLRVTLEIMAFRYSVTQNRPRLSADLKRAWEAFSSLAQRAGETAPLSETWEARHRAFHLAFFAFYKSPATSRLFENVYDRFDRYRRLGVSRKGYLAGVIDDHTQMLDLISNHEDEKVCALIRRHISDVVAVVQANIDWTP